MRWHTAAAATICETPARISSVTASACGLVDKEDIFTFERMVEIKGRTLRRLAATNVTSVSR